VPVPASVTFRIVLAIVAPPFVIAGRLRSTAIML